MRQRLYTVKEMAVEMRCSTPTVRNRLKKLNINPFSCNGVPRYLEINFVAISQEEIRGQKPIYKEDIELYKPFYITETFHIYESKINKNNGIY